MAIEIPDFTGDILSSKAYRSEPLTMEALEEVRQTYLGSHSVEPIEVRDPSDLRQPPTDPMDLSTWIMDRFH